MRKPYAPKPGPASRNGSCSGSLYGGPNQLRKLTSEALKLAPDARTKLAQALVESLDDLSEAESEHLWVEEAVRRDEQVDAGKVPLRPAVR